MTTNEARAYFVKHGLDYSVLTPANIDRLRDILKAEFKKSGCQTIFCEAMGAERCRDECIKSVFKAKRAIYFAGKALKLSSMAWKLTAELYPQTKSGEWFYSIHDNCVYQKPEVEK